MVISHILGGIGNQMFQYAAGRALSLSKNQPFYLDVRDFEDYSLHSGFQLNAVFRLDTPFAYPKLIESVLGFRGNQYAKKIIKRPIFKKLRGEGFIMEPHAHYWPEIQFVSDNCYLYGYWQSEKYFKAFEGVIRRDFCFKNSLNAYNADLKSQIEGGNSISVHIRRGDYINDSKTSKIMNICGIKYYEDAIQSIGLQVKSSNFYIFSDDMNWVRENLSISQPVTYVDNNLGVDSYIDMQLMSCCKHNIIANSSFSWWGAWLNPNPKKIIIAPSKWFSDSSKDKGKDIVPSTWLRI